MALDFERDAEEITHVMAWFHCRTMRRKRIDFAKSSVTFGMMTLLKW